MMQSDAIKTELLKKRHNSSSEQDQEGLYLYYTMTGTEL